MTDRPRILVPDVMDDPWQMPKKKKKEKRERTGPTLGIAKHGDAHDGVKKKLRTLGIMKHYGPVHPGTSSSQKPHGNWSRSVPIQDYVDEDGTIQTWDRDSLKKPRRFEPYTQPSLLDAEGEVKPSLGIYDSGDKPYVSPIKHPLKRPDMGPRLEGIMKRGSARRKRFMKHMAGVEERRAKLVDEYAQMLKERDALPDLYSSNNFVARLQTNIARAEAARWGLDDSNGILSYLNDSKYGDGVLDRLQAFRDDMRSNGTGVTPQHTLKLTKNQRSAFTEWEPGTQYDEDIERLADQVELTKTSITFKSQEAMDVWRRRFRWAADDARYMNQPSTVRMFDKLDRAVYGMPPILEGGAQANNDATVYIKQETLFGPDGERVAEDRVNWGKPRFNIESYREVNAKEIVDRNVTRLAVYEPQHEKVEAQHRVLQKKLQANTNRRLQMWREEVHDFIRSEGIETGGELQITSNRGGGPDLAEAATYYPKAWVDAQNKLNSEVSFVTKKGKRAHYSSWKNQIQRDGTFGTDIHELGHIMEKLPNIRLAMEDYNDWRKFGYKEEKMQDLLRGHGYGARETTTLDEFIHPYSGRNYGSGSYEILTMGMQTLYTGREIGENGEIYSGTHMTTIKGEKRKYNGVDAEQLDFIFGLMDIDPLDKSGLNDLADSV